MKELEVYNRVAKVTNYAIQTGAPVRSIAKALGMSKSTVYSDLTEKLPEYHNSIYEKQIKPILEKNKAESHIRGGEATKRKKLNLKNVKNR